MNTKRKEWARRRACLAALVTLGCATTVVQAAGNNSVDLHAYVQVAAPLGCGVEVTPPSGGSMTARWDTGSPKGTLSITSTTPPSVVVTSTGSRLCSLNNLTLTTDPHGATPVTDNAYALLHHFTNVAGTAAYWRFVPYLAQAKFYTSADQLSGEAAPGVISFNDPDPTNHPAGVTFANAPKYFAGDDMPELPDARDYKFMTDEYVADGGALLVYDQFRTGRFYSTDASATYQSAVLSFGALLATDPEGAAGTPDPTQAPTDGTQLDISWTVTVSAA